MATGAAKEEEDRRRRRQEEENELERIKQHGAVVLSVVHVEDNLTTVADSVPGRYLSHPILKGATLDESGYDFEERFASRSEEAAR